LPPNDLWARTVAWRGALRESSAALAEIRSVLRDLRTSHLLAYPPPSSRDPNAAPGESVARSAHPPFDLQAAEPVTL
jgi:hypothetical protein